MYTFVSEIVSLLDLKGKYGLGKYPMKHLEYQ